MGERGTLRLTKPDSTHASRPTVVRVIPVLDFGGVETNIVQQALSIDRARFDFRVCTFWRAGEAARRIEAAGIPVDVIGLDPAIRNPRATLEFVKYLRRMRPDLVHSSIGEANFHAALTARAAGVSVVIIEEQGIPSRSLVARGIHAVLYRGVDALIGVSDAACRYLRDVEWAPRARVRRIYNCAGEEFFSVPLPTRDGLGQHIATVGRLVEVKNQAGLIRAFAEAARDRPSLRLTIVGEGPLRAQLEQQVHSLGLDEKVSLPGFRADVRAFLDTVDAFALPSFSEGFGIALVEAMARGLPVFASTAGALPELMGTKAAEWSADPGDLLAWSRMIARFADSSPSERLALGEWARERAQEFSPEAHINAVQDCYEELLRRKATHQR